jgi:hypothetical protein
MQFSHTTKWVEFSIYLPIILVNICVFRENCNREGFKQLT